jgi:succinoglycan biosynthesis transport protein ExoP
MRDDSSLVPTQRPQGGWLDAAGDYLPRTTQAPTQDEVQSGINLHEIWRVLFKWRLLILASITVCALVGVVMTMLTTKMYRSASQIEVALAEARVVSGDRAGSSEGMQLRDPQYLATQYGLLRSRALAERVSRSLNLAGNPAMVDQRLPREVREKAAVGRVVGGLTITPVPSSRLISIEFQSQSPQLAAQIPNAYAESFIASNLERKYDATAFARQFLERRIATVKGALEKSERALVDYAEKNDIVTVGGETNGSGAKGSQETSLEASTLSALNTQLTEAQNARISLEQSYQNSRGSTAQNEVQKSAALQGLRAQRASLQAQYQDKLSLYKPDYPEMVGLQAQIQTVERQISAQEGAVAGAVSGSMKGDYLAAVGRERELARKVEQLKASVIDLRGRSIQYTILQREVDTNRTMYEGLLSRFKEVSVEGGVGSNLVSIVDRAEVPGAPFKPSMMTNVSFALVMGVLIGIALAFGIEYVDDTIKNPDDIKDRLGLTLLGVVPTVGKEMTVSEALLDPKSAHSESYFAIRTAIQFATAGGVPKSLLITSTQAAEGKSNSSFAIARSFARIGYTVLLIDGDMRKPTFKSDLDNEKGLSSLLASMDTVMAHVVSTSVENLSMMQSGPIPPNAAELLASERLKSVLREAEGIFDLVVVDSPPILGLADAPLLSSVCDVTVFVVQAGKVRRPAILRSLGRLRIAGAHIIGGIITKFDAAKTGYGYGQSGKENQARLISLETR